MQQRSFRKEKNAGLWDLSAGHIASGETPKESLIREIKEEIGVDVSEENIELLSRYWREEVYREDFIEHELDYIYLLEKDINIEDIVVQEEEVEDIRWIDIDNFKSMLEKGEIVKRQAWEDLFEYIEKKR